MKSENSQLSNKIKIFIAIAAILLIFVLGFIIAPLLTQTFSQSSDLTLTNRTEVGNGTSGARLTAPVVYFDFNSDRENNYIKDNSLYNNFGDAQ